MPTTNTIRWGGLAAMLGSALGIVIAPVITSAYSMTEDGAGHAPPWEPALGNLLGPLLAFASPETVYVTYGKAYVLVFFGLLLGLASLYGWRRGLAGRLERWGFGLSFVGLVLNLFGNVPDYWMGEGTIFEDVGFLVGTALGLLVLMVGSIVLGIALLRARAAPRLAAWLLILAPPGTFVLNLIGFSNLPSGPALWFSIAWLVLGLLLWSNKGEPIRLAAPASR